MADSRTPPHRAFRCGLGLLIACWTSIPAVMAAPPSVNSLFPSGAQRGTAVEIHASGTFDTWPPSIWSSSAKLEIKPLADKGKLRVAVAAEAEPGVHWLRFHDADGASGLRPFLVGTLPDVREIEPNDDTAKAQLLRGPAVIDGKLGKSGDVDCFAFTARKGDTLVARLDAHFTLRSPMDAILQVVTPEGQVLAENHDTRGLDPQLAYPVPSDGQYVVRVFAFPATPDSSVRHFGSDLAVYRLTVTSGPFVDYATPLAIAAGKPAELQLHGWNLTHKTLNLPGDASPVWLEYPHPLPIRRETHDCHDFIKTAPGSLLRPPFTLTGGLTRQDFSCRFLATRGQSYGLSLESASLGFSLNPVVSLTGPDGKPAGRFEPAKLNADLDVNFTATQDGPYRITVADLGQQSGARYVFRLRVSSDPALTAGVVADRLTMSSGASLQIPITFTRLRTTDELDVVSPGLDPRITAKVVKADAKTLTVQFDSPLNAFSGPLRLQVVSKKEPRLRADVTAPVTDFERSTADLWLSISGKK